MSHEELDPRLASLPAPVPADTLAARVRRRAHGVLAEERALADSPPWVASLMRLWSRRVGPALLTGTVALYLVWIFATIDALFR